LTTGRSVDQNKKILGETWQFLCCWC